MAKYETQMPRNARVEEHIYAGMSRPELHTIAVEKVRFYQRRQRLGEPMHHLLDAWQWVEKRLRSDRNVG